jgi:ABC-type antimicrobial peptide transport system permease subunit
MRFARTWAAGCFAALVMAAAVGTVAGAEEKKAAGKVVAGTSAEAFQVPVEYYKLANGLRVVVSQDHTAPTVCVAVYYRIGFRIEPKDRTGFAHLFEH